MRADAARSSHARPESFFVWVRKQRKRVGGAEEADAMADLWWRAVAFLGALSFSLTLRLLFFSLFHLFHKVKG